MKLLAYLTRSPHKLLVSVLCLMLVLLAGPAAVAQVPSIGVVAPAMRPTHSAVVTGLSPASSATDIFTITGSATKTVRVTKAYCNATADAAGSLNLRLAKRSTANSGGTASTVTSASHDSTNSAASAVVRSYTANPTTGTLVGYLRGAVLAIATATAPAVTGSDTAWNFSDGFTTDQAVTLRGTGQVLAVNAGGVSFPAGSSVNCGFEWNEQ